MKLHLLLLVLAATVASSPVFAKDAKFVGVWEGEFGTPIYTKLVLHEDNSLTYCDVSSCHYVNCMKMEYSGSLLDKFTYENATGKYQFSRISEDEIEATFEHAAGDISEAYYEPE